MRHFRAVAPLVTVLCLGAPQVAAAQSFFDYFLKPEYLIPVSEFPAASGGDYLLTYYQVPLPMLPNGEFLIVGEFPRARYFSITAYDDHGAVVGILNDKDIVPYGTTVNPYATGGPAGAEDILYAVTVRMGATMAVNPLPQCATPGSVHTNVLDLRTRHTAGSFYSSQQSAFTANVAGIGPVIHTDTTPNTGGFLLIRSYAKLPPAQGSQVDLTRPLVFARASANGCAVPVSTPGKYLPAAQWYSLQSVMKLDQAYAHVQHEADLGTSDPYGADPLGESEWFGREEYLPGQAVGRYLSSILPLSSTALNSQGRVMQMQFRLPHLPCRTSQPCTLTGDEELRYWSLTFENSSGQSLGTFSDLSLIPDADGYVTLVISFGTPVPAHVSAANGYSRLVTGALPFYRAVLRNYLPGASFECSTANVPVRTGEMTPNGGYMGPYVPVITFPLASTLPLTPPPLVHPGTCTFIP